ncbi:type II secretion system protein [bacterium]|nr:type II secretion system protein [bacterium]
MFKGSKNAFTLAEVLITLGIIGVVAAMTMPTLLNSTQGAQYRAAYKKGLSVLSQAVVMNIALDDFDLSQADATSQATTDKSLSAIIINRMNVAKKDTTSFSGNYTFYFNDGMSVSFATGEKQCTAAAPCKALLDVNGEKNPNTIVSCDANTNGDSCKVTSPTDRFPIKLYDQTVAPNSHAARAVMYKGK